LLEHFMIQYLRRFIVAVLFAWFCIALLASSHPTFAADKLPDKSSEDLLKSKGLTKVGNIYVLTADVNLPEWIRATRAQQKKVEDIMRRRANLTRDLDAALSALDRLEEQNRIATQQLDKMNKKAEGSYNHQVDAVNAIRAKLREGTDFVKKRQMALQEVGDPSDEYVAIVLKMSEMVEALAARYGELDKADDVKAAIDRINASATAKVKLGPSERFNQELPVIRKLNQSVNSATIRFDYVGGVPCVPVTLNASVTVDMVVDSGAAMVSLSAETAAKIGLKPGPNDRLAKFVSADGAVTECHIMTLKSVRLGNFTVESVECSVSPSSAKGAMDLLGGSFLRRFVYKMDLAAGSLKISEITTPGPDGKLPIALGKAPAQGKSIFDDEGGVQTPQISKPVKASGPTIVSARWGGGNNWSDVSAKVKELTAAGTDFWANPGTLGADPTPGWRKHLEIKYANGGDEKSIWYNEDKQIRLVDLKP
jgi:clan AA aspartic protease (TIGR02281 family)